MCTSTIGDPWIVVTVLDEEIVAGLICSTGCLIDYAAKVSAEELEEL